MAESMIGTFSDMISRMWRDTGKKPARIVVGLEAAKKLAQECYSHHNGRNPAYTQYEWESKTLRDIENGEMYLFSIPLEAGWVDG